MTQLMIETRGLTKRYGTQLAVDDVDLHVAEGARYGFLGPNGSGKTTLVRMLLGLVFATRGEIEMMGRPVPSHLAEVLPQIGAMVEGPAAYPHLSGRANLALLDASGPRGRAGRRDRRARISRMPCGSSPFVGSSSTSSRGRRSRAFASPSRCLMPRE